MPRSLGSRTKRVSEPDFLRLYLIEIAAFASAAGPNASKISALQKSKTAIGIRGSDAAKPVRRGDDNSGRVAEVYASSHRGAQC